MRDQMILNEDTRRADLIEGMIVDGLVQCRAVSDIAADIDRLLQVNGTAPTRDIRLVS